MFVHQTGKLAMALLQIGNKSVGTKVLLACAPLEGLNAVPCVGLSECVVLCLIKLV